MGLASFNRMRREKAELEKKKPAPATTGDTKFVVRKEGRASDVKKFSSETDAQTFIDEELVAKKGWDGSILSIEPRG